MVGLVRRSLNKYFVRSQEDGALSGASLREFFKATNWSVTVSAYACRLSAQNLRNKPPKTPRAVEDIGEEDLSYDGLINNNILIERVKQQALASLSDAIEGMNLDIARLSRRLNPLTFQEVLERATAVKEIAELSIKWAELNGLTFNGTSRDVAPIRVVSCQILGKVRKNAYVRRLALRAGDSANAQKLLRRNNKSGRFKEIIQSAAPKKRPSPVKELEQFMKNAAKQAVAP